MLSQRFLYFMTVMMRNNLFEEINRQWDCIVLKNTYFQRIFMGIKKGIKKIAPWKIVLWKIAPNSDPIPNWGNLLGGGAIFWGAIFLSPQKRRVKKLFDGKRIWKAQG